MTKIGSTHPSLLRVPGARGTSAPRPEERAEPGPAEARPTDAFTRGGLAARLRLGQVGGALIVEGNPALEELSLPSLEKVGRYVDLEENDALSSVDLGQVAR